ncbi:MAG: helix-turn-helix domain-containing protein [Gemmatimonadales bacterium]
MPLVTLLTSDPSVQRAIREPADASRGVTLAAVRSWDGLLRLIRERPVTAVVIDSGAIDARLPGDVAVGEVRRRYPSLAIVFIARPHLDPVTLFRLGRAGIGSLVLLPADILTWDELGPALWRALGSGTDAIVTRAVSPYVPPREIMAVRLALEGVQRGWSAEELAGMVGLTRAHISMRLRSCGLPSAGHMLTWAKLLHGARWLSDPGRSAQSISRQLEYSSGAAFRRALRTYVGLTPTQIRDRGGLGPVLDRFLDACGLPDSLERGRSVA